MNVLPRRKVTVGQLLLPATIFELLAATAVAAASTWILQGALEFPSCAWAALIRETIIAVSAGFGVMALTFHSNRDSWTSGGLATPANWSLGLWRMGADRLNASGHHKLS